MYIYNGSVYNKYVTYLYNISFNCTITICYPVIRYTLQVTGEVRAINSWNAHAVKCRQYIQNIPAIRTGSFSHKAGQFSILEKWSMGQFLYRKPTPGALFHKVRFLYDTGTGNSHIQRDKMAPTFWSPFLWRSINFVLPGLVQRQLWNKEKKKHLKLIKDSIKQVS